MEVDEGFEGINVSLGQALASKLPPAGCIQLVRIPT